MTTMRTDNEGLADTLEEQFLELLCSDEDLVQAEFEAIIAAEWPSRPPGRPPQFCPHGQPPTWPTGDSCRSGGVRLASRPRHPGIGGWARQRSPPG